MDGSLEVWVCCKVVNFARFIRIFGLARDLVSPTRREVGALRMEIVGGQATAKRIKESICEKRR